MKKKNQSLIQLGLFAGVLLFINILGNTYYNYYDLTEDKRFTLTDASVDLMDNLKEEVYVKVLLKGEFGSGFKRLQKSVKELLDDYRSVSTSLKYDFVNPLLGSVEEVNARKELYAKSGILPVNLREQTSDSKREQLTYPYALIFYQGRETAVNLLENNIPGQNPEIVINNSISLLEYKITAAIKKLRTITKPVVLYTTGHGEISPIQTADLDAELLKTYDINRINLDSVYQINPEVDVLIIAKPVQPFTDKQNFIVDQYVMNGGRVLWLLDKVNASLDSMQMTGMQVPLPMELNLENMLFKYGARVQPNLVMDLECTPIPLQTGVLGGKPQYELFPWYYFPRVASRSNHPVVKSIDRVNLFFANRIDTIETRKGNIHKEILLATSDYSRYQRVPTQLTFEILRDKPNPSLFNKPHLPVAVLMEGVFPSEFENRVTESMLGGLKELNIEFKTLSQPTRMIVVADGDIATNRYDRQTQKPLPLGLNPFDKYQYSNKQFLMNCIDYLYDDKGVIEARGKDVKLRLLNSVKAKKEKTYWQFFNIILPILLLAIFGFLYNWVRRRRYGSHTFTKL
ncbi:MAG TPA: gliding motility-associated ABC transporter substrate-binding protein GldG [Gammaproteobacteria bacterium]|nr:gliding motility-associated ABC transporter substrate-binding protein GldG [Gammaproteobacteria bacterium]